MCAIPKIVGWLGGIMVFLGSFQMAHVYAETSIIDLAIQAPMKEGLNGIQTEKNKVLLVEGRDYGIKDPTGKELRLILDPNTQKISTIQLGERIEGMDSPGSTQGSRVMEVGLTASSLLFR
ncbi:MAG TPA: hypothetical protein VN638_07390 [Nitrospiraceae bacterium]|nr:hypothetical protein [Nitrospiraceae bacterium]